MSRSAKPHYRNRVDASVSGGERETPAADDEQERRAETACFLAKNMLTDAEAVAGAPLGGPVRC